MFIAIVVINYYILYSRRVCLRARLCVDLHIIIILTTAAVGPKLTYGKVYTDRAGPLAPSPPLFKFYSNERPLPPPPFNSVTCHGSRRNRVYVYIIFYISMNIIIILLLYARV